MYVVCGAGVIVVCLRKGTKGYFFRDGLESAI